MKDVRVRALALLLLVCALFAPTSAFSAATITIANNDAAGVGFNDSTVVAPVGGNTGTTLGQQRLNAFQSAATTWGATLDSTVAITIRAQWTALPCTSSSAVLGAAGAIAKWRDFPGVPFANTWYNESLTSKITGADPDPTTPEITAIFNVNLGNIGCLSGTPFYLGLDNNHGTAIDLVSVLLHEFGHGLGFQTFTNGTTGAPLVGFLSIYDRFVVDLNSGKSWLQMTDAERATSAVNARKLAWDGPRVTADVPAVLLANAALKINSPMTIAGTYEAGAATFGPPLTAVGVTGNVVQGLDPADGAGVSTTDGCSPLTNPAAVAGKIAIIDRGTCTFISKVKNAQNAGAIAVIIADNVSGSPPAGLGGADATITIPSVRVTLTDGISIKGQLGTGVNVTLQMLGYLGTDTFSKPLLFSPNPFQSGSSVSHWDTSASPNQLMEPNISDDLTHNIVPPTDLTFSQMRDIGWVASVLPTSITKTSGDGQNAPLSGPFVIPFSVTAAPGASGITVTWTVNPNGSGAGATFPSTNSRFAISTTNALGVATAPPLTANGQPGLYFMNATVPGAGTTTFSLSNDPLSVDGPACLMDTTQAHFLNGVATNTDVNTSPGDVILLNPATLDQQNETLGNIGGAITATTWGGQTFTPTVTGQLVAADVNLFCSNCFGTPPNLTLSVRATNAGLPTGEDLASATIAGFSSGAGGTFTGVFSSPATLLAGTQYALAIRPTANPLLGTYALTRSGTSTAGADIYPGGARLIGGTSGSVWSIPLTAGIQTDAGFHTFMKASSALAGDFVSRVKDANPPVSSTVNWGALTWNAVVPFNTSMQFQVAGSNNFNGPFNFVGPNGTAGTFFGTGGSLAQFNRKRFLKTKTFFTTTNGTVTPSLNDVTVCYNNVPLPDLSITKTNGITTAVPGGSVTYTIVVSNRGSTAATGAVVVDTFPAVETCTWTCSGAVGGTCTAAGSGNINDTVNLPATASVTYVATCSIAPGATGTLSNTATVTLADDPNPANNSATDSDTLTPQANLAITSTDGVTAATPGGSVTYVITANNPGPSNASGVMVTDTFPASLACTWTCVGAVGGTCTAAGTGNINSLVNLPRGSSAVFTASCAIAAAATGTLTNTAAIIAPAGVIDLTPGDNSVTDIDALTPLADATIIKTDGVTVATPGGSVTYVITASNPGPSDAPGVTVADSFPAALTCTWTCASAGGSSCTAAGAGNINSTVNLPRGGSAVFTASCAVAASATGSLSNTATVSTPAGVTDPVPGNNSSTDSDQLLGNKVFANGFEDAASLAVLWIDAQSATLHESGVIALPVGAGGVGIFSAGGAPSPLASVLAADGSPLVEVQARLEMGALQVRLLALDPEGGSMPSEWLVVPIASNLWTLEINGASNVGHHDGTLVLTINREARITLSGLSPRRQMVGGVLVFSLGSARWVPFESR